MFKKILFPTDFSDVAASALEFVKQLKDSGAEEVIVLNVLEEKYFYLSEEYPTVDLEILDKNLKEDALKKLAAIANALYEKGYKVKVITARGVPASEILRVEQEEKVSIIVLGSHGVSNLKEMLLGSVSEAVIRKSKQPVLVVKRESEV
jgi:nucleotide-binding universal stress UspA family protein